MPLTPLHYPIAYLVYRLKKNLSLPGLIVGSMFPDFEIPVIFLFFRSESLYDRLVLHSLLGAVTIGTLLSVLFTIVLFSHLVTAVFPVRTKRVKANSNLSGKLVLSCLIGTISHVVLDVTTHRYNPVFWPFQTFTVSHIFTPQVSSLTHVVLASFALITFIIHRQNPWNELFIEQ